MFAHSIKENALQFNMNSWIEEIQNHYRRGQGHMLSYLWNRVQWNYFHQFNIVPKFPLNIDIESASSCNIKCEHCFRQYINVPESGVMPFDLYCKIIDECAKYNLFTLKFSMRGEPTVNPQIVEMVDYAKKKGIKEVWVNTNGSLLTEKMAEGFIKADLDCLSVSFDGLRDTYEKVRTPLKYEDTLSKIEMFRSVRDKMKSSKPLFKVQTIWSAIKDNPDEYFQIMNNIVDKIAYNIDFDYQNIHFVPDPNYVCYRLWQRLSVTSKGYVLKCPSDFGQDEILGNVQEKSLKEIWDSEQQKERQRHLDGKRLDSEVCKNCHHGAKIIKEPKKIANQEQITNEVEYI